MKDMPPPTPYKGTHRIATDSPWLASDDLPDDKDTIVTIEAVVIRRDVKMEEGRKKDVALSLVFTGKKRELLLNATNRKTLTMLSGSPRCEAWFGLTIALFKLQGVRRPDGTKGPAIRIRPKHVKGGAVADEPAEAAQPEAPSSTDGEAEYREIMGAGGGA